MLNETLALSAERHQAFLRANCADAREGWMRMTVDEARSLAERVLVSLDHSAEYAGILADHLIDCELRGLPYGGLPRLISIVARLQRT